MSMKIKKWIHQIGEIHSVSSVKKKSSFKDGNYFETNTKLQHFFLHRNVNLQNNRYLLIDGGVIRHLYDIFLLLFSFPRILRQLKWHSSGEKNGATWFSVFFISLYERNWLPNCIIQKRNAYLNFMTIISLFYIIDWKISLKTIWISVYVQAALQWIPLWECIA